MFRQAPNSSSHSASPLQDMEPVPSPTKNSRGTWEQYMNAKLSKLQRQGQELVEADQAGPSHRDIFKGLSIHVNGCFNPSNEELRELILNYGGRYDHYYNLKTTTHVVAENLAACKINRFSKVKIVRPEWITESIQANRLLPLDSYSLFDKQNNYIQNINMDIYDIDDDDTNASFDNFEEENAPVEEEQENIDEPIEDSNGLETEDSLDQNPEIQDTTASPTPKSKNTPSLKAGDPGFLEAFFSKSRLHHLSTAGNDFKRYVEEKRLERKKLPNATLAGIDKLRHHRETLDSECVKEFSPLTDPVIMHIDMDCFFVSVGLKSRPNLKGLPVAVTHAKTGRGRESSSTDTASSSMSFSEVASCNYEARKYGIRNGMLVGTALHKCPQLKFIPYEFEEYSKVSRRLYDLIFSYTLEVEAVSCDEMFVNLKEVLSATSCHPETFASFIRSEVKSLTDCEASVGIGPNVLVAKLASKNAKPNGQLVVPQDRVKEFMASQKVSTLPGIGNSIQDKLAQTFNVETCAELMSVPLDRLRSVFGPKTGENLFNISRGIDRIDLKFEQSSTRKSVSVEVNYGIRFQDFHSLEGFLIELCQELVSRLKATNCVGKNITVKLKVKSKDAPEETLKFLGHGLCDNISRSTVLPLDTDSVDVISKSVVNLVKSFNLHVPHLRGIGIQVTRLTSCSSRTSYRQTIADFLVSSTSREPPAKQLKKSLSDHPSSLEDIDESVLSELPEDIRREVMASFPATSSQSSPSKQQRTKNTKKVSKLVVKSSNISKSKTKTSPISQGPMDKLLNQMRQSESRDAPRNVSQIMSERGKFCGVGETQEICSILREWIVTEESPEDEDVAYITRFLLESIEDKAFERIEMMMNTLYEDLILRRDAQWIQVYNTLTSVIRSELEEIPRGEMSHTASQLLTNLCHLEETCQAIMCK